MHILMVYHQTISALVLSEGYTAHSYTQLGNLAMFVMTIGFQIVGTKSISLLFLLAVQCILILPIRNEPLCLLFTHDCVGLLDVYSMLVI